MILIFEKKEIGRWWRRSIEEGREEEKLGDRLLDLESYDKKEKLLSFFLEVVSRRTITTARKFKGKFNRIERIDEKKNYRHEGARIVNSFKKTKKKKKATIPV